VLLLGKKTPLSHRGGAVSMPWRAGEKVVLRFATEEEVEGLVKGKGAPAGP
jgi:hypothetical protein